MKKSEKILLSTLGAVCLVAGYLMLFEEESTTAKVEIVAGQFEEFVQSLQSKVDERAVTDAEQYALELLVAETPEAPFYVSGTHFYFEEEIEVDAVGEDIVYSGYMRFGDQAIAIISDMEYAVGDMLVTGDFRVVSISRQSISLEHQDPNTGRITKRQVQLVEDDVEQITLRRAGQ